MWKAKHPRAAPRNRAAPEYVNRRGERLGLQDDRLASDADEDYDSDGGFVVRTDEEDDERSEGDTTSGSEQDGSEDDLDIGGDIGAGSDDLPDVVYGNMPSEDDDETEEATEIPAGEVAVDS